MRLRARLTLSAKRLGVDRGRRGVGHVEDRRDPAQRGGASAGFEVFLVLIAGLAEVNLAVDNAGQHMEATRFDHPAGLRAVD